MFKSVFKHTCQTGSELSPNVVFKTPKLSFSLNTHKPMGPTAESCPIRLTILTCSPTVTCLSHHSHQITSQRTFHTLFSSPKPTARPHGWPSSDFFPTFEAPAPASELDQLRRSKLHRARTSSKTLFSSRASRPTRFCQEVPTILPPSASLLRFLNALFIFFSILNALWCECLAGSVGLAFFFFFWGLELPLLGFLYLLWILFWDLNVLCCEVWPDPWVLLEWGLQPPHLLYKKVKM